MLTKRKKTKCENFGFNPIMKYAIEMKIIGTRMTRIVSTMSFEKKYAETPYIFAFSSFKNTGFSIGMVSTMGRTEFQWVIITTKNRAPL